MLDALLSRHEHLAFRSRAFVSISPMSRLYIDHEPSSTSCYAQYILELAARISQCTSSPQARSAAIFKAIIHIPLLSRTSMSRTGMRHSLQSVGYSEFRFKSILTAHALGLQALAIFPSGAIVYPRRQVLRNSADSTSIACGSPGCQGVGELLHSLIPCSRTAQIGELQSWYIHWEGESAGNSL